MMEESATSYTPEPEIDQVGSKRHFRHAIPKSEELEQKYEILAIEVQ